MDKEIKKVGTDSLKQKMIEPKKDDVFLQLLETQRNAIEEAIPKYMTVERMMRIAQSAYSNNEKLMKCDPMSIIGGVMLSAQLGLEINSPLGEAYLIPYNNFKTNIKYAQFQIGYRGILNLAYRTNIYKMIGAWCVYENDEFEHELGLKQTLRHIPAKKPIGSPIYYYAIYKTVNGGEGFTVMSKEQIEDHKNKFSKTENVWKSNYDSMAKKTVLKMVLNYAPKSIEYQKFVAQDGSVKREISSDMSTIPSEVDFESLQSAQVPEEK